MGTLRVRSYLAALQHCSGGDGRGGAGGISPPTAKQAVGLRREVHLARLGEPRLAGEAAAKQRSLTGCLSLSAFFTFFDL